MPRGPRLDSPGLLHHVRARGIERRRIFHSDGDRDDFLNRLESVCGKEAAFIYAWCLMPNHVHLAIQTGADPLSRVMQRLLTGYAVNFNKKHQRAGHLFENRYRSKVVEDEPYLLALVRYIHLNPIRAGLVSALGDLAEYPWCGHSALMGGVGRPWQETETVLARFGGKVGPARRRLADFMSSTGAGKDRDLFRDGGGDARVGASVGDQLRRQPGGERRDYRIVGGDRFIESVLQKTSREQERRKAPIEERWDAFQRVMCLLADKTGLSEEELTGGGRRRAVVKARSIACHVAIHRLGLSLADLSRELHVSPSNVLRGARRGADLLTNSDWGDDLLRRIATNATTSP